MNLILENPLIFIRLKLAKIIFPLTKQNSIYFLYLENGVVPITHV